jgi:hypothetical protein
VRQAALFRRGRRKVPLNYTQKGLVVNVIPSADGIRYSIRMQGFDLALHNHCFGGCAAFSIACCAKQVSRSGCGL